MTYYAVTEDPNELMHFGIKGMKWGVIRTPEQLGHHKTSKPRRQRSAAYNRAAAKLSRGMQHGIAKAKANWKEYNSPKAKAIRTYKKNEKRFEKHVELARQGRLKYKGISDAEVQRITDRLELENYARQQSGRQKQSFARRVRSAAADGIVEGVGRGTSSYINERMQGRGRTTAKIKGERREVRAQYTIPGMVNRRLDNHNKNREAKQEAKREARKEYYETVYSEGDRARALTVRQRANYLSKVSEKKKASEEKATYDKKYNEIRASTQARLDADRQGKARDDAIKNRPILGTGTALQNLNTELEKREHYAQMLNDTYDYYDRQRTSQRNLSEANRQARITESKARADAAKYTQNMRNQQEQARKARDAEIAEANRKAEAAARANRVEYNQHNAPKRQNRQTGTNKRSKGRSKRK